MKNTHPIALGCLAALLFTFANTDGTMAQANSKTQTEVSKADSEKETVRKTYAQIGKYWDEGELNSAFQLMTRKGSDSIVEELLFMCMEVGTGGFDDLQPPEKILEISKKYEFQDLIPNDESMMDPAALSKIAKKLRARIPEDELLSVVSSIRENLDPELNQSPFSGECKSVTVEGKTARLEIALDVGEMAMDDEDPFLLPMTFNKVEGQWKFHEINYEEMEMRMPPFEIQENLTIVGQNLDSQKLDLAELKGKVVLIDFWGTWCGPCVQELGPLKKIYEALHPHGFEVLGVAVDEPAELKRFFEKKPLPWNNIVDSKGKIADRLGVQAFPTVLLVNRQGEHIESNLFGGELMDRVIKELNLDPKQFAKVRSELGDHLGSGAGKEKGKNNSKSADNGSPKNLPVGFDAADANADEKVSTEEMEIYLTDRLQESLPFQKIFDAMDADDNNAVDSSEFENRHHAISWYGLKMFAPFPDSAPADPGANFQPFAGRQAPSDDGKTMAAVYYRYQDFLNNTPYRLPQKSELKQHIDASIRKRLEQTASKNSLERCFNASLILAGNEMGFFTAGAVFVSPDGLALTNYHVAQALNESAVMAMTPNGKSYEVTRMIAGNPKTDVALVEIDTKSDTVPFVAIADNVPKIGDNIKVIHHSENRFYTYDRGYVMRHPSLGNQPWMEISADYAPGGSGCGIFDDQFRLVGLVSTIAFGSGPELAEGHAPDKGPPPGHQGETEDMDEPPGMLLVKHAVSTRAILNLLTPAPNNTKN